MDDYLELGSLLEAHLKAGMPDSPVQQLTNLGEIDKIAVRGHLICIAFASEGQNSSASPYDATITQRWLTVVSVQTAGRALESTLANTLAGPLLARLGKLVQGQRFPGFTPLQRIPPPAPRYLAGFAHFALAWETSITLVSEHEVN